MSDTKPVSIPSPTSEEERTKLLRNWLKADQNTEQKFPITWLTEIDNIRAGVLRPLSEIIFLHHNNPDTSRKILARLGYGETAKSLDRRPKTHNTRLGNFGEVIASEFLRQLRGYEIPVYRLRYNTNDESSPKGDDVLAFEFADKERGTKDTVIVAEVKVRADFSSKAVEDAHDALKKGFRPRPNSLPFVVEILYLEKRDEEAERLLDLTQKFGKRSLIKKTCLFIVTGNKPRDPFKAIVGKKLALGLEAVQLTLEDLSKFINEVFEVEVDINAF